MEHHFIPSHIHSNNYNNNRKWWSYFHRLILLRHRGQTLNDTLVSVSLSLIAIFQSEFLLCATRHPIDGVTIGANWNGIAFHKIIMNEIEFRPNRQLFCVQMNSTWLVCFNRENGNSPGLRLARNLLVQFAYHLLVIFSMQTITISFNLFCYPLLQTSNWLCFWCKAATNCNVFVVNIWHDGHSYRIEMMGYSYCVLDNKRRFSNIITISKLKCVVAIYVYVELLLYYRPNCNVPMQCNVSIFHNAESDCFDVLLLYELLELDYIVYVHF